jgi:hypothetical protein
MRDRWIRTLGSAALAVSLLTGIGAAPAAAAKHYRNCTALNKVYKHGVGRPHAHDHTSGTPVTNFYRSRALYNANSDKDRDGDGIACEKR